MNEKANFMDEFSIGRILNAISERWDDDDLAAFRKKYKGAKTSVTDNFHNLNTGKAVKTLRRVAAFGGTGEEIDRCLEYLVICMDAKKYQLDCAKAFTDLGIGELMEKYKGDREQSK